MIDKELDIEEYKKAVKHYLNLLNNVIEKGKNGTIVNKALNKYMKERMSHNDLFIITDNTGGYQGGILSYSYKKDDIELWLEFRLDTGIILVYNNMLSRFPRYMEEIEDDIWIPVDGACYRTFKKDG